MFDNRDKDTNKIRRVTTSFVDKETGQRKKVYASLEKEKAELREIRQLTEELTRERTKHALAALYEKILDYGSDIVLATANLGPILREAQLDPKLEESLLGEPTTVASKVHESRQLENAQFLLESSRKIPNYDPKILESMERAFKGGEYGAVMTLAGRHDTNCRPRPHRDKHFASDLTDYHEEVEAVGKTLRASTTLFEMLDEVVKESDTKPSALKCCVDALKFLSKELTYENKANAKDMIRRAMVLLENQT